MCNQNSPKPDCSLSGLFLEADMDYLFAFISINFIYCLLEWVYSGLQLDDSILEIQILEFDKAVC